MSNATTVRMTIREQKRESLVSSLVLVNEQGDRFLPVRLSAPSAKAMQLELEGGGRPSGGVETLLDHTLKYMNGRLSRVELRWEDRPGLLATMVIDQEGKEVRFPTRIIDAMVLAHRHGAPIHVEEFALTRQGIRASETGAQAANADWMEAFRLTCGFTGLGRVDDAILACRRLRELDPPNESWCGNLGNLYRQKGMLAAAAKELYRAVAWYMREGYLGHAVETSRDLAAIEFEGLPRVTRRAPAVIEDFSTPAFNHEWMGAGEVVPAPGRDGASAYRIDPARTWFILLLMGTQSWERAKTIRVDVHAGPRPEGEAPPMAVGVSLGGAREGFFRSPYTALKPGWNSLAFALADPIWTTGGPDGKGGQRLDGSPLGPVLNVQCLFERAAGDMAFANFRLE